MIRIERAGIMNLENAVRGARNPMNSWERMDSGYGEDGAFILGANDLQLAQKLVRAGGDHRKFMRQIFLSADITAPLYWWKEFDTYKVGTTANSTSTMHKIHSRPFSRGDFSHEKLEEDALAVLDTTLAELERLRRRYLESKDKGDWYQIIQLLPSSYHQLRTCTMNYENLINIYHARKSHKLDEWIEFCRFIESLPYAAELICG